MYESYNIAKMKVKKAARETRFKMYKELYCMLETQYGEKDIYKIMRLLRKRKIKDFTQVKYLNA